MKAGNFILLSFLFLGGALGFSSCKGDDPNGDTSPIQLDCGHFKTAQTLSDDPDRPVDYYIDCVMSVEADIVVQPGVVIEFAEEAGIEVTPTGSFNATGLVDEGIVLRGANASQGTWKGILFNSNSSANRLEQVTLSHAGSSSFNSNNDLASVIVWADARLTIEASTINAGGGHGISAIYTNSTWSLSNSTVTGCKLSPSTFLAPYLSSFDGSNALSGNTNDYLLLDLATQSLDQNLSWKKSSVPYRITSTFNLFKELNIDNCDVSVEPGVTVQFEAGTGLVVEDDASLSAKGSAAEPIIFTGTTTSAGAWTGIYFNATSNALNEISNAEINYAGATLDYANAGVIMRVDPTLTLDQVSFNNITGCSVFNKNTQDNPNLTATNLTHNQTQGTICHE